MGATVKRIAAHKWSRFAAKPECEKYFAIQSALAHGVITIVRAK